MSEERDRGIPLQERERAARHWGVSPSEVTPEMILGTMWSNCGLMPIC